MERSTSKEVGWYKVNQKTQTPTKYNLGANLG